ncbi:MAG: hypothetical protein RR350_09535, partial [Oscillibacter sp.]
MYTIQYTVKTNVFQQNFPARFAQIPQVPLKAQDIAGMSQMADHTQQKLLMFRNFERKQKSIPSTSKNFCAKPQQKKRQKPLF